MVSTLKCPTVVDFEGILWDDKPPVLIYGEPRCRDFAKRLDNGKPNLLVAVNGKQAPCTIFAYIIC
jgi:hypothetical protein